MIDTMTFAEIIGELDPDQKKAVNVDANCVVTAGAGSGKTTVLSYRFLRLVAEQRAHVDEILTLTFSRAAAAEMHERIHRKLSEFQYDRDIHEELNRFADATITTIDAFCSRVVASDPTRYGIGPDYITDEDANKRMAQESFSLITTQYAHHKGLQFLATLYAPEDLMQCFVSLAQHQFHPASSFDASQQAHALGHLFRLRYRQLIRQLLTAAQQMSLLDGEGKQFIGNQESARYLLSHEELLASEESYALSLEVLEKVSFRKCSGKKDHVLPCNELIETIREFFPDLLKTCAALVDVDALVPLYDILAIWRNQYLNTKRERGILTFSDVAHMARDILLRNSDVRRYYKQKFRYIMVDEFQDTNQLQKDLVYLLAEVHDQCSTTIPEAQYLVPDKLFFVGDEKQSIYRFRGADVSVFKSIGAEIESAGGKTLSLKCNYRSEPVLIDHFNTIFSHIMQGASKPFEARFEKLASRQATDGVTVQVSLAVKPLESAEPEGQELVSSVEAEAYTIAQQIKEMVDTDTYLISDGSGGVRRPSYQDIALLFRTSSNQLHYEKALRIAGIPYTIAAVQSLFLEAPANDICSMLQLLLNDQDKLAFTAVLRSPLCRLSDDVIMTLLDIMEAQKYSVFFDAELVTMPPEDRSKYEACRNLYHNLCTWARWKTTAQLVSDIWYAGGYRSYLLSHPLYQVYLEHFDFLYELAIQYDIERGGLPAFLDFVRPYLGQNKKLNDIEPLRDSVNGVQLMTIHKSKGLEFPIVFVVGMGSAPAPQATPLWHVVDHDGLTLLVPRHMRPYRVSANNGATTNLIYDWQKEILADQETAEMKRLFYVALTRAQDHLILTGCENVHNQGEKAAQKNFLAMLREVEDLESVCRMQTIEDAPLSVLRSSVSHKEIQNRIIMVGKAYQHPKEPPRSAPTTYAVTHLASVLGIDDHQPSEESPLLLPSIGADVVLAEYDLSAHFGTWVHALLEYAITTNSEAVYASDALAQMPKVIERMQLPQRKLDLLTDSAIQLAQNFLTSDLLASLRAQQSLAIESEVRFLLRYNTDSWFSSEHDHLILAGSIDLLVRFPDCVRIIDFKTDSWKNPKLHELQLSVYREAARRLYALPVYSTLCYVRAVGNELWMH
jgi:ATP-dependent exoDNAse (exonuclease V) beta subunit